MNTHTIDLGDFLRILAARLTEDGVDMPLKNERLWQRLFFTLKKERRENFNFLKDLRFDCDGPFPRSKELAEYIQALHWTGNTSATNPSWERMTLDKQIAHEWMKEFESMDPPIRELAEHAFQEAKKTFTAS
jgi:hypothetical protein